MYINFVFKLLLVRSFVNSFLFLYTLHEGTKQLVSLVQLIAIFVSCLQFLLFF